MNYNLITKHIIFLLGIFFIATVCSCRNFFADIESTQSQSVESIEFTIPALIGNSSSSFDENATWSVYALLCGEGVNLNDSLLNKMIVDGAAYTEDSDFEHAYEHNGILAQQSFIDKKVNEPVAILFPNILAGTNFFIRVLIVQDGRITYTGTSPEQRSVLTGGTGGVFSINKSNLHVVQSGQNIVHVILRRVISRVYYVSEDGVADAASSERDNPTTFAKAVAAIATQKTSEPVRMVLVGDMATAFDAAAFADALKAASDIELSSLAGNTYSIVLPEILTIPENARLTLDTVKISNTTQLAVAMASAQSALTLADLSRIDGNVAATGGSVTLDGNTHIVGNFSASGAAVSVASTASIGGNIELTGTTTFTGDITATSGKTVALKDTARIDGNVTGTSATIVLADQSRIDGNVAAAGGSVTLDGNTHIVGNFSASSATVSIASTASIDGNIELSDDTVFNGNVVSSNFVKISDKASVTGTVVASGLNCIVSLMDTATASGVTASGGSLVSLFDAAKIDGDISAVDAEIIAMPDVHITGNIELAGSAAFTGDITAASGKAVALKDTAHIDGNVTGTSATIVLADNAEITGIVTANGGTVQLGGNARAASIVLDADSSTYGYITVMKALTHSAPIPVVVRNTEALFEPFASTPVLVNDDGTAADYASKFAWKFEYPCMWKFETETKSDKTVVYIKNANNPTTPVWLFEVGKNETDENDTFTKFFMNGKSYGNSKNSDGIEYRFSTKAIFSTDVKNSKSMHIYGWFEEKNKYEIMELISGTSVGLKRITDDKNIMPTLCEIYKQDDTVYFSYTNNDNVYLATPSNSTTLTCNVPDSIATRLKGDNSFDIHFCVDTNKKIYIIRSTPNGTSDNLIVNQLTSNNTTLSFANSQTFKSLPIISGTQVVYNDIIYFNSAVYILVGQCDSTYSRGGVIKVATAGSLSVDSTIYGLTAANTAESDEQHCFYNPVRFLGVDGNKLIIADDGRTASGVQKNRVVYFDTTSNAISEVYYTDVEFLGVW